MSDLEYPAESLEVMARKSLPYLLDVMPDEMFVQALRYIVAQYEIGTPWEEILQAVMHRMGEFAN